MMPTLAEDFTVIAVDQRGIGLSDTAGGYDSATLANDLAALMTDWDIERFAVVGHDTGYVISYALAADHRDRVDGWPSQKSGPSRPRGPGSDPPPMFVPDPSTTGCGTSRSTGSTTS